MNLQLAVEKWSKYCIVVVLWNPSPTWWRARSILPARAGAGRKKKGEMVDGRQAVEESSPLFLSQPRGRPDGQIQRAYRWGATGRLLYP